MEESPRLQTVGFLLISALDYGTLSPMVWLFESLPEAAVTVIV